MNGYGNFNNNYQTGGYYSGMMYQEQPKLTMTQGLNKEQLNSLRKTSGFSLDISEEELWRSFCTHRYENKFAVTQDEEGNFICSLCGTKFKPYEGDVEEAKELVDKVMDFMETTKMQALNLPPKTIQDVFQIEPILKRLPDLFAQSRNDYRRALGVNDGYVYGQENNAFAMYQNMINPMAGNGYYDPAMMNMQQPMYGAQAPMQQPMMNMQPMYAQPQMYGQQPQMQPMMNMQQPMYGGQPPQQNPFNSNPAPVNNQPQQQPAQQNNNNDQVTVNKTLTD